MYWKAGWSLCFRVQWSFWQELRKLVSALSASLPGCKNYYLFLWSHWTWPLPGHNDMLHERAVESNQSIAIFSSAPVSDSCPLDGDNWKIWSSEWGGEVHSWYRLCTSMVCCVCIESRFLWYYSEISRVFPCAWLAHLNNMSWFYRIKRWSWCLN